MTMMMCSALSQTVTSSITQLPSNFFSFFPAGHHFFTPTFIDAPPLSYFIHIQHAAGHFMVIPHNLTDGYLIYQLFDLLDYTRKIIENQKNQEEIEMCTLDCNMITR